MKQLDFPTAQEIRSINPIADIDQYLGNLSYVMKKARAEGQDRVISHHANNAAERVALIQFLKSKGFTVLTSGHYSIEIQW